jgi:hypothetical protein
MKMKAQELYELPIGARLTQKELAAHFGVDCPTVGRSEDSQITLCISYCDSSSPPPLLSRSSGLAYVNLYKVPMTGTCVAESLTNYAEFDKIFMAWYCSPYGKEHS